MSGSAIQHEVNQIHHGDAVETLQTFPESSVHFCMTSPPYYQQRDYGVDGQIGQESHHEEYIENILEVGKELKRVLRDDGSWWLNLGDKYSTKERGNPGDYSSSGLHGGDITEEYAETLANSYDQVGGSTGEGIPEKSLMFLPTRVAMALVDQGWICRVKVPWHKTNPESAKDRLWNSNEYVFHLVQQKRYWHNPEELNEWALFDIPPAQNTDAHFAVFPPELCETPLKGTCPPKVCSVCGTPYDREVHEKSIDDIDESRPQARRALELARNAGLTKEHLEACRAVGFSDAGAGKATQSGAGNNSERVEELAAEAKEVLGEYFREFTAPKKEYGPWEPQCDCENVVWDRGIAIDPFAGSGTLPKVAKDLDRRFVGIELNPDYVAMAQARTGIDVDEPERLLEDGETAITAYGGGD